MKFSTTTAEALRDRKWFYVSHLFSFEPRAKKSKNTLSMAETFDVVQKSILPRLDVKKPITWSRFVNIQEISSSTTWNVGEKNMTCSVFSIRINRLHFVVQSPEGWEQTRQYTKRLFGSEYEYTYINRSITYFVFNIQCSEHSSCIEYNRWAKRWLQISLQKKF